MSINEFNKLVDVEQEEVALDAGVFLTSYTREALIYDLYKVFNFYVKFVYDADKNLQLPVISASDIDEADENESYN